MTVQLSDEVLYRGKRGHIGAVSGSDQLCIVRVYGDEERGIPETVTGWVPMSQVVVIPPEKKEPEQE